MKLKKNIKAGKVNFFILTAFFIIKLNYSFADTLPKSEMIAELSVLDKVSSKNTNIKIQVGEEFSFQNLTIKVLKCYNSTFDDDPEVTAYIQVKDVSDTNNEKIFVFNGWTFSSTPYLQPLDHPVYDIWLVSCENV